MRKLFFKDFQNRNKVTLTPESQDMLMTIAQNCLADLTTIQSGHFSHEDLEKIMVLASEKLSILLSQNQSAPLNQLWRQVVESFHRNHYWGYVPQQQKPVKAKVENKQESMFPYVWTAIQALIIMKLVILYFGLKSAQDESGRNTVYVVVAILFSFSSLLFFAWKKGRNIKD